MVEFIDDDNGSHTTDSLATPAGESLDAAVGVKFATNPYGFLYLTHNKCILRMFFFVSPPAQ